MLKRIRDGIVILGATLTFFAFFFCRPLILIAGVSILLLNHWIGKRIETEERRKWERERKKLEDDITCVASWAYWQK